MVVRATRVLSLCSGVGGLDEGVRIAFEYAGRSVEPVCYVEREVEAAAVLAARMADAALPVAPVWSDLTTFDARPWRGIVDLVVAGVPCQPFSNAGKQQGTRDERWLWPSVERILRECDPQWFLLENVRGLRTCQDGEPFRRIAGSLAGLGYDAAWLHLPASAVGAPHQRTRLFLLAYRRGGRGPLGRLPAWRPVAGGDGAPVDEPDGGGRLHGSPQEQPAEARVEALRQPRPRGTGVEHADGGGLQPEAAEQLGRRELDGAPVRADAAVDAAACVGRGEGRPQPVVRGGRDAAAGASGGVAVSEGEGLAQPGGQDGARQARPGPERVRREALADADGCGDDGTGRQPGRRGEPPDDRFPGIFPPGPADLVAWRRVLASRPDLAPALPPLRRVADGVADGLDEPMYHRVSRIRAVGNGVVPLQAALALLILNDHATNAMVKA